VGRESVDGIATGYGLDGPGIEIRWRRDFQTHPERPREPPSHTYRVPFQRVVEPTNSQILARSRVGVELYFCRPAVPAWQRLDANSLIYWPTVTMDRAMVSNERIKKMFWISVWETEHLACRKGHCQTFYSKDWDWRFDWLSLCLFNGASSSTLLCNLIGRMILNDERETICEIRIVAYFEYSNKFHRLPEENHLQSQTCKASSESANWYRHVFF
jgi:hypothetical protein